MSTRAWAAAILFVGGCVTTTTTTTWAPREVEPGADTGVDEDASESDAPDPEDAGRDDEPDEAEPCPSDEGRLPRMLREGPFLARETAVSNTRNACTAGWHAAAGAAGSTLTVTLDAADDGGLWLAATDLLGEPLTEPEWLEPGDVLSVPVTQSGEVFVEAWPADPGAMDDPPAAYTLSTSCRLNCDRPFTRYPVVFLHGMGGTDSYLGTLDYWFGIEDAYTDAGLTAAFPAADALASIDTRAQQWREVLDQLEDAGVGRRFNLIAHSQGGLDARLLAHRYDPDARVASITTVSSPHRGTVMADLGDGALDVTPFDARLVDQVVEALAWMVGLDGPELSAQVDDLTRASMARFNEDVPDRPDIPYWSWAGVSCRGLDWACQAANDGEVIDSVFSASFRLIDAIEGPNDGVVSRASAEWGTFLGELPADHMDEVGQIADLWNPAFDAQEFYVDEARRLAEAGL